MEVKVNGDLVKRLRLERAWSQELLADKSGLNLRTIQRLESSRVASLQTRRAVAEALGIDPKELESKEDAPKAGHSAFQIATIVVGVYALGTAVSFGLTVLDQVYAYLIRTQMAAAESAFVFSEVADFLLQIAMFVTLLSFAALAAAWDHRRARVLIASSLAVGTGLPIVIVLAANLFLPGLWASLELSSWGASLRFVISACSMALAIWAWFTYVRSPEHPTALGSA